MESPPPAPAPAPQKNAVIEQQKSKNVSGPPVYYPPGVELFSKKEEQVFTQQQVINNFSSWLNHSYSKLQWDYFAIRFNIFHSLPNKFLVFQ